MEWPKQFKYDPVKPLIESDNPAVFYLRSGIYCSAMSPRFNFTVDFTDSAKDYQPAGTRRLVKALAKTKITINRDF